jgi:hypothetical protein
MALVEYKECGSSQRERSGLTVVPRQAAKTASRTTWLAMRLGISVVGIAMSVPSTAASSVPTSKAVDEQQKVLASLQITEVDSHKGGFTNIMMLNATVQNSGKRDVKDIKVVCNQSPSSQAKVDANSATIYGPFPAGKSKSIHEVDMGIFHDEAKGANCSIVHATLTTKRWGRAAR